MSKEKVLLIYDKQCPACDNYCQVVKIRESIGGLVLIDARENTEVMQEISNMGLDIDQGMVLKMGETIYYGSDAIHALALISCRSGIINRLNYWIIKSKGLSKVLYPVLRFLRNILLKLLGLSKINNLNIQGNDKF